VRIGLTERRLFPWVLALVAFLLVGGVSYVNASAYVATEAAVRNAISAQQVANETLSLLKDVEIGGRGFVITGNERFLEPFEHARLKLPGTLTALNRLSESDPELVPAVRRVEALAAEKLAHNTRMIELRRSQKLALPEANSMIEQGKLIMDAIRAEMDKLLVRTDSRLHDREHATATASRKVELALEAGLLGAVLLVLVGLSLARKDLRSTRRINEQLARDVEAREFAEKRLLESEQRYRVLAAASFEGVVISRDDVVVDSNANFADWVGYAPEELLGMPDLQFFVEEDRVRVRELAPEATHESSLLRRDGTRIPVEIRNRIVMSGGRSLRIATIRDVTEKKRREAELESKSELLHALSIHDELTGLYNRRGFMQLASEAMNRAADTRSSALYFADLNGMKVINDQLGHDAGDHAIRTAAQILRRVFDSAALIARLGGDEFAIFVQGSAATDVRATVGRLEEHVQAANAASTQRYRLSISMGAATSPPHADLPSLMQAADSTMYEAKRARHERSSLRVARS
jgi:diguanylate cyclase (GGDEF)-like protein/PAS domain S-box-containing protein